MTTNWKQNNIHFIKYRKKKKKKYKKYCISIFYFKVNYIDIRTNDWTTKVLTTFF